MTPERNNPMEMNHDPEWLNKKADAEDGCNVSVGGTSMTPREQAETILSADYYGTPEEQGKKRVEDLAVLIESASLAGAEDMRRRCLLIVDEKPGFPSGSNGYQAIENCCEFITNSIRALTPTSNVLALAEARGRMEQHRKTPEGNPFLMTEIEWLRRYVIWRNEEMEMLAADLKRLEEKA